MKNMLLKMLNFFGFCAETPKTDPQYLKIEINQTTTRKQLAEAIANHFVGVVRAENRPDKDVVIFADSNHEVIDLAWGEEPCSIGFLGQSGYALALVKIPFVSFRLLKHIYEAIGTENIESYIAEYSIDMEVMKVTFPIGT